MAEEYEILPHQLLSDLKYDVEALKKKLSAPDAKANELILEMESLKDSVHELTTVFQKALEETKGEGNLSEKLARVVSQNETIATGMVAISDKLEEFMTGHKKVSPHQLGNTHSISAQAHPSGRMNMGPPPSMSSIGRMAPPPQMEMNAPLPMQSDSDFPPPPPTMDSHKRKGLFGK